MDHLLPPATGEQVANPRQERRDRACLAKAQRMLSRKAKDDGTNRHEARRKVAMIHARIARRRRDGLHKLFTRIFPSSRQCSACGTVQGKMPLPVRTWWCGCGTAQDRDVNAARDVLAAGRAVSACGAGVRPQRRTPGGQSATKQEISRREP